jgi:hypothetical protein
MSLNELTTRERALVAILNDRVQETHGKVTSWTAARRRFIITSICLHLELRVQSGESLRIFLKSRDPSAIAVARVAHESEHSFYKSVDNRPVPDLKVGTLIFDWQHWGMGPPELDLAYLVGTSGCAPDVGAAVLADYARVRRGRDDREMLRCALEWLAIVVPHWQWKNEVPATSWWVMLDRLLRSLEVY